MDKLNKLEISIENRIEHLRNGNASSIKVNEDVNDVRKSLEELEQSIKEASWTAEELDEGRERAELIERLKEKKVHLKKLEIRLKQAILQAKRNANENDVRDREELLRGGNVKQRNHFGKEDSALKASIEVTKTMKQTLAQINQQIERNTQIGMQFESSSNVLRRTKETYGTFQAVLGKSKNILHKLNQRDRMDKLLITFAFIVFLLVVLFIIKQRIWFPGFSLLFGAE